MEVDQLRSLPEMSADPVTDVIHRQRPDAPHAPDFFLDQPIQRGEVCCLREFAADPLKPGLDLFQKSTRNTTLMRMTLAA
jgi:hypothetical protein